MANATQRDPNRIGVNGLPRQSVSDDTPRDDQSDQAPVRANDTRGDMKRAAEENAHLLGKRSRSEADISAELVALRTENAELRHRLDEWEQLLNGPEGIDATWAEKQREYEALLEEKTEVIRGLHTKIHELQEAKATAVETADAATAEAPAAPPVAATPAPEATGASVNEVLELQRQLEEERRQLKEDEQALMAQMKEMEMAMSRDRAELARHRAELQRLHTDLNRELENASRDAGLRERLLALTRRPAEGGKNRTTGLLPIVKTADAEAAKAAAAKGAANAAAPNAQKGTSGFFRRMFGG
jgi:chromosome segregation ATPase